MSAAGTRKTTRFGTAPTATATATTRTRARAPTPTRSRTRAPSKPGTRRRAGWDDEAFVQPAHRHEHEDEYVFVDAHLLCTPAIADLDGDGRDEIILSVSYFYDKEYYDNPAHAAELGVNVDVGKYVAGGVYVADLETLEMRWQTHLDLSTDAVSYRAYMYSAPTVVDIDRDGYWRSRSGPRWGFCTSEARRHDAETLAEADGRDSGPSRRRGRGRRRRASSSSPRTRAGAVAAFRRDGDGGVGDAPRVAHIPGRDHRGRGRRRTSWRSSVGTLGRAVHVLSGATGAPKPPFPFLHGRTRDDPRCCSTKLGSGVRVRPGARRRGSPGGLIPGRDLVRRVRVRDRRRARGAST